MTSRPTTSGENNVEFECSGFRPAAVPIFWSESTYLLAGRLGARENCSYYRRGAPEHDLPLPVRNQACGTGAGGAADRGDRADRLARRPQHLLRLPLFIPDSAGGDGVAAMADSSHGNGLYGTFGCFRAAAVHCGQFATAGHSGFYVAGGDRVVRIRNQPQPATGTGEPGARGTGIGGAKRGRGATGVLDRQQPGGDRDHVVGLPDPARQFGGAPAVRGGAGATTREKHPSLRACPRARAVPGRSEERRVG